MSQLIVKENMIPKFNIRDSDWKKILCLQF